MRSFRFVFAVFVISYCFGGLVKAQPIPVEVMVGDKYGSVNVVFNKSFTQTSRLGFFHMNTVQFDYNEKAKNSFILQDLATVETFKNLKVTGGVAYSKAGLSPTAGLQYSFAGKKFFFLFAPRVNIEADPSYDIMTILQLKTGLNEKIKFVGRIQMLNLFDKTGNIKSYQWLRLGIEMKGIQFGLAANFDEFGPSPSVEMNTGLFIRKDLF
jgi:hypothetical protein